MSVNARAPRGDLSANGGDGGRLLQLENVK